MRAFHLLIKFEARRGIAGNIAWKLRSASLSGRKREHGASQRRESSMTHWEHDTQGRKEHRLPYWSHSRRVS